MNRDRLELAAPAKVNLYLNITGRRDDGYHYLVTLMQKISLFDRLLLQKSSSQITLHCPDSNLPENEDNLVYRAARLFFDHMAPRLAGSPGAEITLYKTIPVAAGLGGGSSDAAAVLKGLNQLYETGCTTDELIELGRRLGADVPLFIVDWPCAWATGIGDQLQPAVSLSGFQLVVVNPGFSISTAWVYANFALTSEENIFNLKSFHNATSGSSADPDYRQRSIEPAELVNDLESVTAREYQEIGQLKQKLLEGGAAAALMTGSGPSVFGLFGKNEADKAAACYRRLQREYQNIFLVNPLAS